MKLKIKKSPGNRGFLNFKDYGKLVVIILYFGSGIPRNQPEENSTITLHLKTPASINDLGVPPYNPFIVSGIDCV